MIKKKRVRLSDIWKKFKPTQVIYFATVDGRGPRVRPVSMIHYDRNLWISTFSGDAKIKQLGRNPNFEFCLMLKKGRHHGYIRGSGRVQIVASRPVRHRVAAAIPFFKSYWQSADQESYCLLKLKLRRIEYEAPGQMSVVRLKVG